MQRKFSLERPGQVKLVANLGLVFEALKLSY